MVRVRKTLALPKKRPRILIWDIESTNLTASFGTVLCVGYKWAGHPGIAVPTILDTSPKSFLDDRGLVERFKAVYEEADLTVAHYGRRFDLRMIQTKCAKYGLGPLAPKQMIDTWEVAKRHFKLHSNRLATLAEYFQTPHQKTPITFDDWLQAAHGNRAAMRQVVEHCALDTLTLEEVFNSILPWVPMPAKRLFNPSNHPLSCTRCGSLNTTRQGLKRTRTRVYQQWKCRDCGSWMRSRTAEKTPRLELISNVE